MKFLVITVELCYVVKKLFGDFQGQQCKHGIFPYTSERLDVFSNSKCRRGIVTSSEVGMGDLR